MVFLQYLISGISLGSIYAIIALGYTMVYGIAKMLNFAHGDAIFFDWDLDGSADHVGLVVGTDGSRVYTVEGNSGDACKIKSYSLSYECIKGYGLMNW